MDTDPEIESFSGDCRLFPLPDLVMFPHALVPLHIFEPRYRQMTADALTTDGLVTIVQIRPSPSSTPMFGPVPIMEVGCQGKIIEHEQLSEGRYNIILLGLRRVRLKSEKPTSKLYRIAEAEIIDDEGTDEPVEPRRTELLLLFRAVVERGQQIDQELADALDSGLSLGVLSDIIAHALPLPSALKQALLSEADVGRRAEALSTILYQLTNRVQFKGSYPQPFSAN